MADYQNQNNQSSAYHSFQDANGQPNQPYQQSSGSGRSKDSQGQPGMHGGGYTPQQQPNSQSNANNHGGGYVPPRNGSAGVGHAASQSPQGQEQGTGQGTTSRPEQGSAGATWGKWSSGGAPSTDEVPDPMLNGVNRAELQLLQYKPPRKRQRGYGHIFDSNNSWRWKKPRNFQMPGLQFESLAQHWHRDVLRRIMNSPEEERYLSPWDGHLAKLVVQAVDDVYDTHAQSTWRRTFMRDVGSPLIRVANWALTVVRRDGTSGTDEDWLRVGGKWLAASLALMIIMPLPTGAKGQIRNHGCYDGFPYRYWGYAKYWRNSREDRFFHITDRDAPRNNTHQEVKDQEIELEGTVPYDQDDGTNPVAERLLRPRHLCFLNESGGPTRLMNINDWLREHQTSNPPDYLFVAYTSEQFSGDKDFAALTRLAEKAARDAGVSAYWISCSCMPDENEIEQDVYRISDVIRGSRGLAIIVGHPVDRRKEEFSPQQLLAQWGLRMWTLPEALLSPRGNSIRVYIRGANEPWDIQKSNFPQIAWHDAPWTRQLMDHYEGSLILSNLELVVLALRCLSHRDFGRISYSQGDLSYVLMGLQRRRPRTNRDDSAFQAFARLSLANDSNMLLERLVCIQPKDPLNQSWLSTDDAWDAQLWDIYPHIQVAGVGADDTVILDGAFGASIRWKSFAPVAYLVRVTWKRKLARLLVRSSTLIFLTALVLFAIPGFAAGAAVLLVISLIPILASPYLVRVLYSGKLWGAQPWFFGFEGYLDIETIEAKIFGTSLGRLTWSPSGSPLSRHVANEYGECIGIDPTADEGVREQVARAKHSKYGEEKVFTLVDTYTSTVTLFSSVRPPIAMLLCASEGGMQRAVMCSYDARTQTLYRETVLRMETGHLQKMFRVGRFRFGFKRPMPQVRLHGASLPNEAEMSYLNGEP